MQKNSKAPVVLQGADWQWCSALASKGNAETEQAHVEIQREG